MRASTVVVVVVSSVSAAVGCPGVAGGEGEGEAADVVTFKELRPLLEAHCTSCHHDGGIAPFSLTRADEVSLLASALSAEVAARIMPPVVVDASGACQTFQDTPYLSDDEIAVFDGFAAGGGTIGDDDADATFDEPAAFVADAAVELPEAYTPDAGGTDDYRCFIVPFDPGENRFITGYDVIPGDRREVHHVVLFDPVSAGAEDDALALDDADEGPGYRCFGSARVDAAVKGVWTPGATAVRFPEGTGLQYSGNFLVVQMHYYTASGVGPDQTSITFTTAPTVARPASMELLDDFSLDVPGNEEAASYQWQIALRGATPVPLDLYGVYPHMHTLGRTQRFIRVDADGNEECLVDVPRYDFSWQRLFFYDQPVRLSPTDVLQQDCVFDTRGHDGRVRWGESTLEEMCMQVVYVVPVTG
jgi:hypothetical protein